MAIDTLEKLEKTKRDYPNQKFAVQFVDKALKKSPRNAYLLVGAVSRLSRMLIFVIGLESRSCTKAECCDKCRH
jgi:disulfide oxidoreductase YuzD